jgi:sugar (pentulose or hexulose) kinase
MSARHHIAVIDIGKTNAKLALVDGNALAEIAVTTCKNRVLHGPPYPHFDLDGLWAFLKQALRRFQAEHGIDAISITTHGAAAVLLDKGGNLAAPMLDYEHDGPDTVAAAYNTIRPDFVQTGSPRLAQGLNLGAQLFWQFDRDPALLARTAQIVTYPQYWGYLLTGQTACDTCSLGCHTDLWNPNLGAPSDLVARLGIADKLATIRAPSDILGQVRADLAQKVGLPLGVPVYVGIHDSNASLLPHLLGMDAPFGVVSTGTWVIAMAMGGRKVQLDAARDTLINVNALGQPVPSARFMGGREYALLTQGAPQQDPSEAEIADVLAQHIMLLPSIVPDAGPFQRRASSWHGVTPKDNSGHSCAAVSLYLAMMTLACLELIGQRGPILVEGPFAANRAYLQMLRVISGQRVLASTARTGTSIGAALLAIKGNTRVGEMAEIATPNWPNAHAYWSQWRKCIA